MRLLPGIALLILIPIASVDAAVVDRFSMQPGDTFISEITRPGEFDEFLLPVARRSVVTLSVRKTGWGNWKPGVGLFTLDYGLLRVEANSANSVRTVGLIRKSALHRVIATGGRGSVGAYRVRAAVKPAKEFTRSAQLLEAPEGETSIQTGLDVGAYAGYTATICAKWRGPTPITLVRFEDSDGQEVLSAKAPVTKRKSFRHGGFVIPRFGDYKALFEIPEGTKAATLTVKLKGSLPKGRRVDVRAAVRRPPGVRFVSSSVAPIVQINGERGGPDDIGWFASGTGPAATVTDLRAGVCGVFSRNPPDNTEFEFRCTNGWVARVENLERDEQGRVTRYDVPWMRSPRGGGSAFLSGFEYDELDRPVRWTEVRHYHGSGNTHRLVIRDVEFFNRTNMRTFTVDHTGPDGETRTYSFAPLR